MAAVELEIGLSRAFPGMSLREIREEGADIVRKLYVYNLAYGDNDSSGGIEGGEEFA